jgi:tyrosyl-tRNA synthetase|tara:strand:+ start:77 stop:1270 length:1194 start_codon:yes stop_codon:yes gene_type:complete
MQLQNLVQRFTSDIVGEEQFEKMLVKSAADNTRLRVKFGIDPTFTDVHLGHSVPIRLLRAFQDHGHLPVLIIGDGTARLGDPTGRNEQRPALTVEDVARNSATYLDQIGTILDLDPAKCEVRHNSEWFGDMNFFDALKLASQSTAARLLERDDFKKRMQQNQAVHLHEMMYPLMQGYDSVMVESDVELGGNDQLFNLHMGRQMQERAGQRPQICMTTPLLLGTDGRKMSKTYGNHVGLNAGANDMYGKIMSLSDDGMPLWFQLATTMSDDEISQCLAGHPRQAKDALARNITSQIHGDDAANAAAEVFVQQFVKNEIPDEINECIVGESAMKLASLLKEAGLVASTSEARRLLKDGAIKVDSEPQSDPNLLVELSATDAVLLQIGKRRLMNVRCASR